MGGERKRDVLGLNALHLLPYALGDIRNFDGRVRLDDAQQVLLQQRVVQRGEVRADRRVRGELCIEGRGEEGVNICDDEWRGEREA